MIPPIPTPSDLNASFLHRLISTAERTATSPSGSVELFGVRGWQEGQEVPNRFNRYNDTMLLVRKQAGGHLVYRFAATVDPGKLKAPNPRGVAHLVPGSYRYQLGLHHGRERALVQAGAVRVRRYFDGGKGGLEPFEETGWFGINIHRGGKGEQVAGWSAGCQALRGDGWPIFLELLEHAAARGQQIFHYHLLEGKHVVDSLPYPVGSASFSPA